VVKEVSVFFLDRAWAGRIIFHLFFNPGARLDCQRRKEQPMLSLEDFIAESLGQIMSGIKKAQQNSKDTGASINHPSVPTSTGCDEVLVAKGGGVLERVHFEVLITASESEGAKGGIGVFTGAFGLGGQVEGGSESRHANRIKFAIPVRYPEP
jgi:hypothetical protein